MKRIEKPDWNDLVGVTEVLTVMPPIRKHGNLDRWFDTHIEPLNRLIDGAKRVWGHNNWCVSFRKDSDSTHTAWLIGIEPLKKETAEDVCQLIVDAFEQPGPMPERQLYEMAKAVLEHRE